MVFVFIHKLYLFRCTIKIVKFVNKGWEERCLCSVWVVRCDASALLPPFSQWDVHPLCSFSPCTEAG